jgi:anti-sigma regulatory factor (Ser/Thr protein kinase)
MRIFSWFLALNLLIVLTALGVKAYRRHRSIGVIKTSPTAATANEPVSRRWTVQNDILGIGKACDAIRDFLESQELPIKDVFDLSAILEEMLSFVLSAEFPDREAHDIHIGARIERQTVYLELHYEGQGCNPLEIPAIDLTKPLDEITLDGMDIHLLRHWTNRLDYRRDGRQCIFTAVKNVTPGSLT